MTGILAIELVASALAGGVLVPPDLDAFGWNSAWNEVVRALDTDELRRARLRWERTEAGWVLHVHQGSRDARLAGVAPASTHHERVEQIYVALALLGRRPLTHARETLKRAVVVPLVEPPPRPRPTPRPVVTDPPAALAPDAPVVVPVFHQETIAVEALPIYVEHRPSRSWMITALLDADSGESLGQACNSLAGILGGGGGVGCRPTPRSGSPIRWRKLGIG